MLRKEFLFIFFLSFLFYAYSQDKIQIITNNSDKYSEILPLENLQFENFSLEILLFDDNLLTNNFAGSINYLENNYEKAPVLTIYIDPVNSEPKIYGINKKNLPGMDFTKIIVKTLNIEEEFAREFPFMISTIIPKNSLTQLYNSYNRDIALIQGKTGYYTFKDILDKINTVQNSDKLYFVFNIMNRVVYMNERYIIYVFATSILIIMLFLVIISKPVNFHLKENFKFLPAIPFKTMQVFINAFISTLVISYIVDYSQNNQIIYQSPLFFLIIKILIILFIYGISFHIVKDSAFSNSPYFYMLFSFYSSFILFLILSIIYLPLGLIQLWPIFCTILFISIKNIKVKNLLFLLSPILHLYIFYQNFLYSDFSIISLFINSKYLGNILISVILMPFILLHESLHRFIGRKRKKHKNSIDILVSLLTLTVTITLIAIVLEINKM